MPIYGQRDYCRAGAVRGYRRTSEIPKERPGGTEPDLQLPPPSLGAEIHGAFLRTLIFSLATLLLCAEYLKSQIWCGLGIGVCLICNKKTPGLAGPHRFYRFFYRILQISRLSAVEYFRWIDRYRIA